MGAYDRAEPGDDRIAVTALAEGVEKPVEVGGIAVDHADLNHGLERVETVEYGLNRLATSPHPPSRAHDAVTERYKRLYIEQTSKEGGRSSDAAATFEKLECVEGGEEV